MKKPTTPTSPPDDLVTRKQVAQLFKVHPETIKRMHRKADGTGQLTPYVLRERIIRYSLAEVMAVKEAAKKLAVPHA